MARAQLETSDKATRTRWTVMVLGCTTSWMLYLHRYTFSLIKPELEKEFGLDPSQLADLGVIFSTFYGLFQIPMGILVDLAGVHIYLGGAIALWSLGLAMHVHVGTLYASRAVLGMGQAGVFAAIGRLTRNWFPASVRSSVQGTMGVSFGRAGGLCAYLLVGSLLLGVMEIPWRQAVLLLAGGGLAFAVIFCLFFRETPRRHPWANRLEVELIEGKELVINSPRRKSIWKMLGQTRGRSLVNLGFLCMAASFSTVADGIYSSWIPMFLDNAYGLDYKEMGFRSALPLAGGVVGGILGGLMNDRLIRWTGKRRWARSAVGFFGKGMAAVTLLVALRFYQDPYLFCSMLFGVKLFADMSLATRWGAVTDMGGRMIATLFAFTNAIAIVAGIVGEKVYGWVLPTEKVARSTPEGWLPIFYIGIGMYICCAVAWLLVDCTIPLLQEDEDDDSKPQMQNEGIQYVDPDLHAEDSSDGLDE
jgi:sugar phosphate permease